MKVTFRETRDMGGPVRVGVPGRYRCQPVRGRVVPGSAEDVQNPGFYMDTDSDGRVDIYLAATDPWWAWAIWFDSSLTEWGPIYVAVSEHSTGVWETLTRVDPDTLSPNPDIPASAWTATLVAVQAYAEDAAESRDAAIAAQHAAELASKKTPVPTTGGLGADDNYVTDAEKVKLTNLSGTNTGDQTLPTWTTLAGKPAVIAAGADAAAARTAIGAGTSSLAIGTGAGDAKAGNYAPDLSGLAPASGQFASFALTAAASVTLSASYPAQSLTMTSATTLAAPTVSDGHAIMLWLTGAYGPTWWSGIKWAGGTPPTYAPAGTLYHLLRMGGAWYASGQAYS